MLDKVDGLLQEKRIFAPALVKEELEAVGGASIAKWAKDRPALFVPAEQILAAAQEVQNRFPGLLDPKAEYEEADAYVIGLAKMREAVVITGETSAATKNKPKRSHFIPDVCQELGIFSSTFLGLMRREKWRF